MAPMRRLAPIDPMWGNLFSRGSVEDPLVQTLAQIPIFSQLTKRERLKLSRLVHVRRFGLGETVIPSGIEQSGVYLIRSGSVYIVRQRYDSQEVVATLGPDTLLGEFALLDSTPRTSSVAAAEASELIGFFKPDLDDLLRTSPALGCKILFRLAQQMSRSLANDCTRIREIHRVEFHANSEITASS